MKKLLKGVLLLTSVFVLLVGCGTKSADNNASDISTTELENLGGSGVQFETPKKGDSIAEVVVKDFGSIYIRFFSDKAPKAVENFVTHAKNGYYDGLTFHRVINEFMIQGGDPTGTGAGGESIWNENFEDEFSDELLPYKGALCMANAGPGTNGSQFFIVQNSGVTEDDLEAMSSYYETEYTDEQKENYTKIGGTPWLHKAHTVFGQMISGYEVLDKIAAVEVDETTSKPKTDVIIETINIMEY